MRVADALDMAEGRSHIPFERGRMSIHSLSTAAIESVTIRDGEERPVLNEIAMNDFVWHLPSRRAAEGEATGLWPRAPHRGRRAHRRRGQEEARSALPPRGVDERASAAVRRELGLRGKSAPRVPGAVRWAYRQRRVRPYRRALRVRGATSSSSPRPARGVGRAPHVRGRRRPDRQRPAQPTVPVACAGAAASARASPSIAIRALRGHGVAALAKAQPRWPSPPPSQPGRTPDTAEGPAGWSWGTLVTLLSQIVRKLCAFLGYPPPGGGWEVGCPSRRPDSGGRRGQLGDRRGVAIARGSQSGLQAARRLALASTTPGSQHRQSPWRCRTAMQPPKREDGATRHVLQLE